MLHGRDICSQIFVISRPTLQTIEFLPCYTHSFVILLVWTMLYPSSHSEGSNFRTPISACVDGVIFILYIAKKLSNKIVACCLILSHVTRHFIPLSITYYLLYTYYPENIPMFTYYHYPIIVTRHLNWRNLTRSKLKRSSEEREILQSPSVLQVQWLWYPKNGPLAPIPQQLVVI